jgi:hypothetical protein
MIYDLQYVKDNNVHIQLFDKDNKEILNVFEIDTVFKEYRHYKSDENNKLILDEHREVIKLTSELTPEHSIVINERD